MPCKDDVLLHGKLVLQSNVKTVCKLGFLAPFCLFHLVPQSLPVCEGRRGVGRQQDFRAKYAAFPGVVAVLSVILAVQLFAGSVSSGRNSGLTCAAFDLGNMEVK